MKWTAGINRVEIVRPDGATVYVNTGDAGLNRLIAAAPDMAGLLARLDEWEMDPDHAGSDAADLAHEARALLAKARGGA